MAATSRSHDGPLSQARVAEHALRIARIEGLQEVSLRRVASELGVTPMALYRHVGDKQELLELVVDLALDDLKLPPPDSDEPLGALRDLGHGLRSALLVLPGAAGHALRRGPAFPTAQRILDRVLALLLRSGFPPGEAARACVSFVATVIGHAELEAGAPDPDTGQPPLARHKAGATAALDAFDADQLPALAIAAPHLRELEAADYFAFHLDRLLDGLRHHLTQRRA